MKTRIFIILLIVSTISLFYYGTTHKNEYINDVKKVSDYFEKGKYYQTIISLFKMKEEIDLRSETLYLFSYEENPEKFMYCIDVLNFVSNYKYNSKQQVNKHSSNTFAIQYTVQMETDNDTKIYKLPVFFDETFDCFGIPRGYPSKNLDYKNIIFYRLSDEKTQQLARKLFDTNK